MIATSFFGCTTGKNQKEADALLLSCFQYYQLPLAAYDVASLLYVERLKATIKKEAISLLLFREIWKMLVSYW